MSKNLEVFSKLLFIDCPWHDRNLSESKFQQQLHKLPKLTVENQPLLEHEIPQFGKDNLWFL